MDRYIGADRIGENRFCSSFPPLPPRRTNLFIYSLCALFLDDVNWLVALTFLAVKHTHTGSTEQQVTALRLLLALSNDQCRYGRDSFALLCCCCCLDTKQVKTVLPSWVAHGYYPPPVRGHRRLADTSVTVMRTQETAGKGEAQNNSSIHLPRGAVVVEPKHTLEQNERQADRRTYVNVAVEPEHAEINPQAGNRQNERSSCQTHHPGESTAAAVVVLRAVVYFLLVVLAVVVVNSHIILARHQTRHISCSEGKNENKAQGEEHNKQNYRILHINKEAHGKYNRGGIVATRRDGQLPPWWSKIK